MASKRTWYGTLLRLYPRAFREQFAESMEQTFRDLCRDNPRGGFGVTTWLFLETTIGIAKENAIHMPQALKTLLRVALGALGVIMLPLVASQFVEDWHWEPMGYVRIYVLLFATGMLFATIARRMGTWSYKAAAGIALAGAFALGMSNMVHVADSHNPANLWYYSVIVVGILGAAMTRLRAQGLAFTLFAMAATLAFIAVILPSGAPPDMARRMAIGHGVFVALFFTAGLLFRHAGLRYAGR